MLQINKVIFLCLLLFQAYYATAQFNISGQITGEDEPLAFATISILTMDSSLVKGEVTDIDGRFNIKLEAGEYIFQSSYIGFEVSAQSLKVDSDVQLAEIKLKTLATALDAVIVTAQRSLIERKPDRLIYNISSNLATKGADLLEGLKYAPGLQIQNNAISMVGRGNVRVMVEDRMIQLSGDELTAFLATIAADDIERIEIITNPPAKYEAAGNAGLINIIYKKGRINSWKQSSSLTYEQNKYGLGSFRNNFSFNKNKLRLNASLNAQLGDRRELESIDIQYPDSFWNLDLENRFVKDNVSLRLGTDYALNEQLSIGALYLGNWSSPDYIGPGNTNIYDNQEELSEIIENFSNDNRQVNTQALNLNSKLNLDTLGKKVTLDIDYFTYENNSNREYEINRFDAFRNFQQTDRAGINLSTQQIMNGSIRLEFEQPTPKIDLSYGAKLSTIHTNNELEDFNTLSGVPIIDDTTSNTFDYSENILAAYINGNKKLSDQLSLQLGLRMEQTFTRGESKNLNQVNLNNYFQLFPTFYLNYIPSDNHNWSLNLGRRINRPNFRDLNPFRIYVTDQNYSEGNPFLRPSFTNTFNLNYTFKSLYTSGFFLNHTTDGYTTIFKTDNELMVQATVRENFYTHTSMGISELIPLNIGNSFSSNNQAFLIYNFSKFDRPVNTDPMNGFQFHFSSSNNFKLNNNWSLAANFWFTSNSKSIIYEAGDTYSLDLSIRKSFFDNALQISLQANDILNTASLDFLATNINDIPIIYSQNYSSRHVRLTINYSFGNLKMKSVKKSFGNEAEQNRS